MAKVKKIIILLSILLVVIASILIVTVIKTKDVNSDKQYGEEDEAVITYEPVKELQLVEDRIDFYTVKNIVNKYYSYYMTLFNIEEYYMTDDPSEIKEAEEQNSNSLYNMLDEEYIQAKGVTSSNLKTKLNGMNISIINIANMYVSQKNDNISVYVIEGMLREEETGNIKQFQIIIKVDTSNETFSVIPQEYFEEKYSNLEVGKDIEVTIPEAILKNKNNTFNYRIVEEETYVIDLFSELKSQIMYFTEQAYSNLEEEYRNTNFATYEEFKEYIENHQKEINAMKISKYRKTSTDNYEEYLFIDQNDNYYILRETAPFEFTMMLDNYTIPIDDFVDEYNQSSDIEKVILNIKRFFMGIDDKNYGYSYSVLSDAFKNNKYPTKNDFIKYAKQNFFEENEINYESYEKETGLYIYKITLTDATGVSTAKRTFNFVVKLNSGIDFEMSFSAE